MTLMNDFADVVGAHFNSLARQHTLEHASASPPAFPFGSLRSHLNGGAGVPDGVISIARGGGNPVALANLREAETVLDLGSGSGLDCLMAARAVGPTGRVVGIDIAEEMLVLAERNRRTCALSNVEFRRGHIEALPFSDGTMDVVISNCVILLSPDKASVLREARRVLKPGGRFVACDVVTEGEIPDALRANVTAFTSGLPSAANLADCGAMDKEAYLNLLARAGFGNIELHVRQSYGVELLSQLDDASRQRLGEGVDWSGISNSARYCEVDIVARRPV